MSKGVVEGGGDERKGLVKDDCLSDESSSIGKNSDLSENNSPDDDEEEEIQSSYKHPHPLAMESLHQLLPIRRGISRFYNGKSKSFTSLADTSSSSSLAKPDNAYIRKHRNLNWERTRASSLRGISKRISFSSARTALAVAVAMSNVECNSSGGALPALRWFSLADLQHCSSSSVAAESAKPA